VFFSAGSFDFRRARQHLRPAPAPIRTAKVEPIGVEVRDPTGCGDVFGGAMVSQLVRGEDVEMAVRAANAAAARNVQYRGATDLQYHLRGEIVPT
jgi:sugar/nucleoside kinase (ribokinase family)